MAKHLTEEGKAFRALVLEHGGDQQAIAEVLGIDRTSVSCRLTTELHGAWWRAFKKKRSKARKAARQRRWRENAAERARLAYGYLDS